jgi:hypothetical protein
MSKFNRFGQLAVLSVATLLLVGIKFHPSWPEFRSYTAESQAPSGRSSDVAVSEAPSPSERPSDISMPAAPATAPAPMAGSESSSTSPTAAAAAESSRTVGTTIDHFLVGGLVIGVITLCGLVWVNRVKKRSTGLKHFLTSMLSGTGFTSGLKVSLLAFLPIETLEGYDKASICVGGAAVMWIAVEAVKDLI